MSRLGGIGPPGLGRVSNMLLDPFLDPIQQTLRYSANKAMPVHIPGPGDLWACYETATLSRQALTELFSFHGIRMPAGKPTDGRERIWDAVRRSRARLLDYRDVFRLAAKGRLTMGEDVPRYLRRLGFTDQTDLQDVIDASHAPLDLTLIFQLWNREYINRDAANRWLKELGYWDDNLRFDIGRLRFLTPPPTDIVRFMLRDVADEGTVTSEELDAEFEDKWTGLLEQWTGDQGITEDVMRFYWRAHWQYPSPTQLYTMLHRLRPNRLDRYRFGGLTPTTVSAADVKRVLGINDYSPKWRDNLAAISYHTLTRVDVRRMHDLGVFGPPGGAQARQEITEQYQDQGYTQTDATRLADFTVKLWQKSSAGQAGAIGAGAVCQAYSLGLTSREDAAVSLYLLSLTSAEARQEFQALPRQEQVARALGDVRVRVKLDECDLKLQVSQVKASITSVRGRFVRGILSLDDARLLLVRLGLDLGRITQFLSIWSVARDGPRKDLSTGAVLKGLRYGYLDGSTAGQRLRNLGWPDSDISVLVLETVRNVLLDVAREQAKNASDARTRERASRQAAQLARRQYRDAQRSLIGQATPAKLIGWYARRLIDAEEFMRRLAVLETPGPDQVNLLREAEIARTERDRRRRPPTTP